MYGRADGVDEPLVRIRREIGRDLRSGAIAPATSISSSTSPSGPLESPVGVFAAPSTETAVTFGAEIPKFLKKELRSLGRYPPPNSITAMHCPAPVSPEGNPYAFAT